VKPCAVSNSTCLICLSRIERLSLLQQMFHVVLVPPAVAQETNIRANWIQVRSPQKESTLTLSRSVVDIGEAEAIALASEAGHLLIMDDRKGRLWAQRLGIPVTGTIGLLVRAKREGHLENVQSVLEELRSAGFYFTPQLAQEALRLTGESESA
jgi:predicted nucleic acid-binding protein